MGFSRQEYWSGVPLPSLNTYQGHVQFSSVQSLSRVRLFATSRTAARQASLSITNSQNLFKLMSTELVMPSNHLILCHPLLLLPSIFPNFRVFSNESAFHIRWPKYWSYSFSISPFNEHSGLISSHPTDLIKLQPPSEPGRGPAEEDTACLQARGGGSLRTGRAWVVGVGMVTTAGPWGGRVAADGPGAGGGGQGPGCSW